MIVIFEENPLPLLFTVRGARTYLYLDQFAGFSSRLPQREQVSEEARRREKREKPWLVVSGLPWQWQTMFLAFLYPGVAAPPGAELSILLR